MWKIIKTTARGCVKAMPILIVSIIGALMMSQWPIITMFIIFLIIGYVFGI